MPHDWHLAENNKHIITWRQYAGISYLLLLFCINLVTFYSNSIESYEHIICSSQRVIV